MPSFKKDVTHFWQLFVVILLSVILRFSDPLSQNVESDKYVQHLVPTKMYITQLLDPLKSHFENNFPSYFALPNKETTFSGSAKKFLSDKLFKSLDDDKSTDFYGKIGTHRLSPLTVTMMMMGSCEFV